MSDLDKRAIYNRINASAGRPYYAERDHTASEAIEIICRDENGQLVVHYTPRGEFWRIDAQGRATQITPT